MTGIEFRNRFCDDMTGIRQTRRFFDRRASMSVRRVPWGPSIPQQQAQDSAAQPVVISYPSAFMRSASFAALLLMHGEPLGCDADRNRATHLWINAVHLFQQMESSRLRDLFCAAVRGKLGACKPQMRVRIERFMNCPPLVADVTLRWPQQLEVFFYPKNSNLKYPGKSRLAKPDKSRSVLRHAAKDRGAAATTGDRPEADSESKRSGVIR